MRSWVAGERFPSARPLNTKDTAVCDTPASRATSRDVGRPVPVLPLSSAPPTPSAALAQPIPVDHRPPYPRGAPRHTGDPHAVTGLRAEQALGVRSGPSAALPNLCARQSHDAGSESDSTRADAKDCGNRASWHSMGIAPPNHQEALLPGLRPHAITRSGTLFDRTGPVIDERMTSQSWDSSSTRSSRPSEPCESAAMCQALRSNASPCRSRAFSRPSSQARSPSL